MQSHLIAGIGDTRQFDRRFLPIPASGSERSYDFVARERNIAAVCRVKIVTVSLVILMRVKQVRLIGSRDNIAARMGTVLINGVVLPPIAPKG